ncbi:glutamate-1-semialdehyde 2,1-aminomutase [Brucella intermedia]|uniref:Glutamate-1-semialdehyde 2,1-aminomutase n=1 Tax=Brucella intermedia GD04153 TaxID=2975438 RepID=A0AA42H733_9HYPH|nr:glutamate-1-semialdehyde 2,1-aminomutase [Brucella intermedia]PJT21731.1 glutamate-1-semialdehyde 2,1-aminomutase [Ochrobactrum sp. 30A/1000/2015]PJT39662.1 glutamate-1-semialdehyde 2,1-aminomutase [Ochrobactrum sp. 27A/999/2015]PJT43956.1 glutamate-1-semialdehyde 2,1-aminomutase [Ochrobactrum sp. 23A/997/2015]KAB2709461.1 glutamate-1-semialdehyde 2,1-aminomutase [Brucella intermedia]MCO7736175.1 glutamate-1-semialdehyde 2,1-aminomutase [Brucella intermedia]
MNLFTPQFRNSQLLASKAHALIPGGCHTYAKGDDQYPVLAPGFIQRGSGSHVFDVDGHEYIEYGMGNRAVGLGHAYPPVVRAVRDALQDGCNFTRPSAIEVECAESFLELIDSADMVKFCKDGSDATSGAVRLARAYTGRDMVACCADHPFFSTDDWFIGTTKMNAGIPASVSALTATFRYNDIASVQAVFDDYPGRIAAIILEPAKADEPQDNFLREARRIAHENGALFILDEMITGFRWHLRGAQKLYDVEPDLSCFGKALGNGFAISALAGKAEYMQLGGLIQTDHPRVFLLSTTHGAETHAMAAAIATMTIYRDEPVIERLYEQGSKLAAGVNAAIAAHGLQKHVRLFGRPCCLAYGTLDEAGQPSQAFRTLFLQETIRRGVLMPSLVVSYTHSDTDIARTVDAIDGALGIYVRALNDGVGSYLTGRPSQVVYRRFNEAPTYPPAMR